MNRLWVLCALVIAQSCRDRFEYRVPATGENSIVINGRQDEKNWADTSPITAFQNPWNKEVSPETSLRITRDGENLYFFFDVKDSEILADSTLTGERGIEGEDRVELFFSKDQNMQEYYCLEMDAKGRTLSYRARHYRQLDFSWEPPAGFVVATRIHPDGYTVEGAIPLAFMNQLGKNEECYFGAYRAEFARVDGKRSEEWLTWKNPGTREPDFHVPASLGKLIWRQQGR